MRGHRDELRSEAAQAFLRSRVRDLEYLLSCFDLTCFALLVRGCGGGRADPEFYIYTYDVRFVMLLLRGSCHMVRAGSGTPRP